MPNNLDNPEEQALMKAANGRINVFDFGGPLSFGAAADIGHHVRLQDKEHTEAVVLDFSRVPFMDVSAANAVETIAIDAEHSGNRLYLSGINDAVDEVLKGLRLLDEIPNNGIFETRQKALEKALSDLEADEPREQLAQPKPSLI